MKRACCAAALGVFAAFTLFAASIWEGNAVAAGPLDFPAEGLYGACNSFPLNSKVEVENLENGKKALVTITRNVDNPGVFIALSPAASAALGMRQGNAARVRVLAGTPAATLAPGMQPRPGESADPDFNPKLLALRELKATTAATTAPTAAQSASSIPRAPSGDAAATPGAVSDASAQEAVALLAPAERTQTPPSAASLPAADRSAPKPTEPAPELPGASTPPVASSPLPRPEPTLLSEISPELVRKPQVRPSVTGTALMLPEPELPRAQASPAEAPLLVGIDVPPPAASTPRVPLSEPLPRPDELPELSGGLVSAPPAARPDFALSEGEINLGVAESPAEIPAKMPAEMPEASAVARSAPTSSYADAPLAEAEAEVENLAVAQESPAFSESDSEKLSVEPDASMPALAQSEPAQQVSEPEAVAQRDKDAAETPEVDVAITLEPTTARPPSSTPGEPPSPPASLGIQSSPAPASSVAAADLPAVAPGTGAGSEPGSGKAFALPPGVVRLERLAKGSYYVQLGVYATGEALAAATQGLSGLYPLAVEETTSPDAAPRLRLYVGPLSSDEGGVVLIRVKAAGYKDAFLRQGS